ncbi:MAG: type II toxin-antitoxin system VapC family toxin [Thermoleophilaceae bacterium]|nr:type II toxin-antitoxin system VapC family toxin [Thermoleophilaceae bacterium]
MVYASAAADAGLPQACGEILEAIARGDLQAGTSVAVLEEVWHLELRGRPRGLAGVTADAYRLFTPVLSVTDEILSGALALEADGLGANDRIHVATCTANGIDTIISADAAFDSIGDVRHIDPGDAAAVQRLIAPS